jgi:hypothetical protein
VSDKNNINWQMLQQMITGTEAIGKIKTVERNYWYDGKCKDATKDKN